MKKFPSVALIAAGCLMLAQFASAQSCTGFSGNIVGSTGHIDSISCQASSALAAACSNSETLNGAGVAIYQIAVGVTNSYTLSATSAAFVPWLGFISTTCSSNTPCIDDVTRVGTGTIATAAHTQADTPGGSYFLIVGDVDVDSPGCGAFSVTWGPLAPVSLQSFRVE